MINNFLNRAAETIGFTREVYLEKNLPRDVEMITIFPFFGDQLSEFVLSSLLHRRIKEKKRDRYLILCTHSERSILYPYFDEVWGIGKDFGSSIFAEANGWQSNKKVLHVIQSINRFFRNVDEIVDLGYYKDGLTRQYFDHFKVEVDLPAISSAKIDFSRKLMEKGGMKIFIHPSKKIYVIDRQGRQVIQDMSIKFWNDLGMKLLDNGCTPVFHFHPNAHDMSKDFHDKAVICDEFSLSGMLSCIRATGCYLDVFGNGFGLAALARTPLIWCEDRRRYNALRLHELEDLCFPHLPRQIVFSFPGNDLVPSIVNRVLEFVPTLDRDKFPSTEQVQFEADYALVRKKKAKRLGLRFFKVPKLG